MAAILRPNVRTQPLAEAGEASRSESAAAKGWASLLGLGGMYGGCWTKSLDGNNPVAPGVHSRATYGMAEYTWFGIAGVVPESRISLGFATAIIEQAVQDPVARPL